MKKRIYDHIPKEVIKDMPLAAFKGRIIVVLTESEAKKAVDFLLTQEILGIDTETRPSFRKGKHNMVSLLQVSTHDTCFLFRLKRIGQSPSIIRLLENTHIPMIGLSLHDDMHALKELYKFTPGNYIDLQNIIRNIGIEDLSLQKIFANLFNKRLNKRQQLSNWDADVLSEKQQLYGATDAWACIKIYEEYLRLTETKDYTIISTKENNEQVSTDIS